MEWYTQPSPAFIVYAFGERGFCRLPLSAMMNNIHVNKHNS